MNHVHVHDYRIRTFRPSTFQRHTTVGAHCVMYSVLYTAGTAVHVQATMQGIEVAQKRTRSGNAHAAWSMQIMHSEGQRNGTRRHNSVHCTAMECATRMLAVHVGDSEDS